VTDTTNIESLYRQHGAALVLFAAAVTGDRGRAQDAVHQVFLRLMARGNPVQASDPKAYLFASVRNAVLNDIKAQARHVTLEAESAWFVPPDRDYAAEQHLQRALRDIPDDQRQIVVLHIWGDLTFSQIAAVLNINSNTAASRFRYAIGKLRELMTIGEKRNATL
jgi:RNA polymerase sigma-70 factor, ECF subfamily